MSTQITTGKVRFSYCNLFTPRAVQEGATPKYSVTLLIPKSDKATMQKIKAAMDEATKLPFGMGFYKQGPLLKLRLPNGRELSYVKPRIDDDSITYEGTIQSSGGWGRIESYGPKLVENIVQATARDCLAVAIDRLERAGFPVVFHVHDEVICEVPIGVSSAEEISKIMSEPIEWATGLPLKADAYECEYYRKD